MLITTLSSIFELSSAITIIGSVGAVLTAVGTYLLGRRAAKTNDFGVLIKANEQFRVEMRTELDASRITIEELRAEMSQKSREISDLQSAIEELHAEIHEKDRIISDLKVSLVKKDIEVSQLQARMQIFEDRA